jgi:hypothetical protein
MAFRSPSYESHLNEPDRKNSERRHFSQHHDYHQRLAPALPKQSKKSNVTGPPNPLFILSMKYPEAAMQWIGSAQLPENVTKEFENRLSQNIE